MVDAYLDIETTGLSHRYNEITVVGIGKQMGPSVDVVHLYESTLTSRAIREVLHGVNFLYTYNGRRFDLPFIREKLGVDIERLLNHRDLMFDCWKANLMGGLKSVERTLGIPRNLVGIDGLEAIDLWNRYKYQKDSKALSTLLAYNREDVVNLAILKDRLAARIWK